MPLVFQDRREREASPTLEVQDSLEQREREEIQVRQSLRGVEMLIERNGRYYIIINCFCVRWSWTPRVPRSARTSRSDCGVRYSWATR